MTSTITNPAAPSGESELAGLYKEWRRASAELYETYSTEQATIDAAPDWAWKTHQNIAQHKTVLLTKGLPEENYEEARRAIAELKTVDYIAAIEPHEAWERQQTYLGDIQTAVEARIVRTPARTIKDVLVKLRIADHWIRSDNTCGGVLEEEDLYSPNRLALSAYADLERLSAGSAS